MGEHHYRRIDTALDEGKRGAALDSVKRAQPSKIAGRKVVGRDNLDGYRWRLEGGGWLLIRFSGTEPLMRVYTEVPERDLVEPVLEEGLKLAGVK